MSNLHRERFFEQIAIMFGREPKKPVEITERAQQVHELKRMANKTEVRAAIMLAHEKPHGHTWRNRRWAVPVSYTHLDVYKRQQVWLEHASFGPRVYGSGPDGAGVEEFACLMLRAADGMLGVVEAG